MRSAGGGARTKGFVLLALVVVLGVGALLYVTRFRDDGPSRAEVARRQESCDRLQAFNSLLADPGISPPTPGAPVLPAAVGNLQTSMGDLDAFVEGSPSKIRTEVRALVAPLRAQPFDAAAIRSPAFTEARQRLQGYLNDATNNCVPAGSGEG